MVLQRQSWLLMMHLSAINAIPYRHLFFEYSSGIDIPNVLHALKARFSLFIGNYSQALSEANNYKSYSKYPLLIFHL